MLPHLHARAGICVFQAAGRAAIYRSTFSLKLRFGGPKNIPMRYNAFQSEGIDPYAVLEIRRDATTREIKNAFIKLSKRYHPDLNKDPHATEKFQRVGQAFKVLRLTDLYTSRTATSHSNQSQGAPGKKPFSTAGNTHTPHNFAHTPHNFGNESSGSIKITYGKQSNRRKRKEYHYDEPQINCTPPYCHHMHGSFKEFSFTDPFVKPVTRRTFAKRWPSKKMLIALMIFLLILRGIMKRFRAFWRKEFNFFPVHHAHY